MLQWGRFAKDLVLVLVMTKTRSSPAPHLLLHPQNLLEVSLACALQLCLTTKPCLTKYITSNLVSFGTSPATLSHWVHHQHVPTPTYTRTQTQTRKRAHTHTQTRTCTHKRARSHAHTTNAHVHTLTQQTRTSTRAHTNANVHTHAGSRQVHNWRSLRV